MTRLPPCHPANALTPLIHTLFGLHLFTVVWTVCLHWWHSRPDLGRFVPHTAIFLGLCTLIVIALKLWAERRFKAGCPQPPDKCVCRSLDAARNASPSLP